MAIGKTNVGGGSGGTLTVTAPAGATVTVSKDGKSKTKVADLDGVAVFKGLSSGDWLLSITDGTQTAQKTVTITADYTTAITVFAATIHVTYPAGSTCTATDGVTTLTAPDTSGTWDCVVPNAGTWTVSTGNGFQETVEVSANGEELTLNKWYLYKDGDERTYKTGGIDSKAMIYFSSGNAYPVGTITKNSDNIYLETKSSNNSQACVATNNKINISNFNMLFIVTNTFVLNIKSIIKININNGNEYLIPLIYIYPSTFDKFISNITNKNISNNNNVFLVNKRSIVKISVQIIL